MWEDILKETVEGSDPNEPRPVKAGSYEHRMGDQRPPPERPPRTHSPETIEELLALKEIFKNMRDKLVESQLRYGNKANRREIKDFDDALSRLHRLAVKW